MQAAEATFARIAQIEVGKQAPDTDRQITDQWMFELAEPAEEAGCQTPWDTIGQQEIDVLLLGDFSNRGAQLFHAIGVLPKQGTQQPCNCPGLQPMSPARRPPSFCSSRSSGGSN